MSWFTSTVLAVILFTLWGFMNGVAVKYVNPYTALIFSSFGYLLSGIVILGIRGFQLELSLNGAIAGILLGLGTGFGGFFVLRAMSQGDSNVSVVIAITSIYPLGVLILSYFFLAETITFFKLIGFVLAIIGVIILCI